MVLAAVIHNGLTHVGDDAAEFVGADVGVGIDGNGGVGAVLDETVHDVFDVAALGAASVEFAIGVGAGTALAKAPVAVGVDHLGAGQLGNVQPALFHRFSPFQKNGPESQLEGAEGCEESGGSGSYDNDGGFVVAVLIVAAIVGCNVFFATIELDGGMVENATAAGVEAPTEILTQPAQPFTA